ncbi:hypothetical protein U9M48_013875 [Paspalum notatum var. saurae]|uniref:Integrase catalytic domain-containing protein n=1 Tax=Paspalum notatum var. saurae TaxID=547442 RepID=A0AAQ3T1P2_PASNO
MAPSTPSNGGVPVFRCPLLFDGTNYRVWVPPMRWHMRGLRLWKFLTGELSCPPAPTVPVPPTIPDQATDEDKTKLLDDFAALEKSYEAQFSAYRLWLDEDARADSILAANMEDQFAVEIGQQSNIELQRTYVLLTRLRDEYEPLRAQLLARHPFLSLIDALAAVHNEEIRLRSAGLLPSVSALAARYAPSQPAVPSLSSPSPAPVPSPSGRGGGGGLHCDYCGKDSHVEAFCYRKKAAQFRSQTRPASQPPPVSQSSGNASAGASQRSSTDPITQEMLMLLRRLAASSPSGTVSVATLPAGLIITRVTWLVLALVVVTLSSFGSWTGFVFLPLCLPPPDGSALAASSTSSFDQWHHRLGEYLSDALRQVLSAQGTLAQFSCPGAHAQNGVAERKHRHLLETARALMLASSVPPHFWAEAVSTATYLINIQPSFALRGGIPLERLCGKTPDYSDLRFFGCVCYVLLAPRERTKLTAHAKHKGYRCWDPVGRCMSISRDVVFDESRPFYPRPSSDASLASLVDPLSFLIIPDTAIAHISSRLVPSPTVPSSGVVPPSVVPLVESSSESSSLIPDYTAKPPVTQVYTRRSASTPTAPSSGSSESSFGEPSPAASSPEQLLGRGHRSHQPVDRYGFGRVTWQGFAGTVLSEPLSYRDAILYPEWQLAMAEEIAALERTGTWDLVPTPSHVRPITCKWVYKVKTRSDGSLERYKARLVARGFQQEHGRDYDETFAHMTTVRALLAVASVREWSISQLDVKNAFLNGELREEVYMQPPPGYSVPEGSSRLVSALCVCGHSCWFFFASAHDPALFVQTSSRGRTLLLLYVDDMIITGDDPQFIAFVKARLSEQFFMSDLGPLRYFLGIEKNIFRVFLNVLSMTDHRTEVTPMELNLQLSATDGEPLDDPTRYRHIVDSHVYLGVTRPDISYSVHILSQFVSAPTQLHYSHLLRVLRYPRGTMSRRLFFPRSSSLQLQAYCDATWASDSSDRRSLSAYCVFLGGSLIAWKTKKQTAASRSSAEAELRAMALATAEVTWLRWLLADFGVFVSIPTPLLTDSTGAISIARDPDGVVTLRYVPSELQLADFLTKAQTRDQHRITKAHLIPPKFMIYTKQVIS